MSFLKIADPRKRDAIVADYLATTKRIQQRNLDERAGVLAQEDDLQNLFKPMIKSTETSTTALQKELIPIQNELKEMNSKLRRVATGVVAKKEDDEEEYVKSDDDIPILNKYDQILERFGTTAKLDPHFSIQRLPNGEGYVMGDKTVILDKSSNIYVDSDKYEGTDGLWELIMMKKPEWDSADDLANYQRLVAQTNVMANPRNVLSNNRPQQTYKWKKILKSLPPSPLTSPRPRKILPILPTSSPSHGEGIHFLPSNIKALESKLEILLGEYRAGNRSSTRNEIVPIANELLRRRAITQREYKDINTFLAQC